MKDSSAGSRFTYLGNGDPSRTCRSALLSGAALDNRLILKTLKRGRYNMIARGLLMILCASIAGAQTANYADISAGKSKLPYGKAVTLTGKMTDLKCGSGTLATILQNPAITVSYV